MPLTRLFVSGDLRPDLQLHLNDDQTRYIGRVLRLRAGDSLAVFNGDKGEFSATVASIAKTSAVIKLHDRSETTTESPLKVHLVQGVSRGERMDFVVQKATELGVKRISPVLTEHGVVKLDASRATRRRDHWQKIAESACEQSGRIRPPLIDTPMPLTSWLETRTEAADSDLILQPGAATPNDIGKKAPDQGLHSDRPGRGLQRQRNCRRRNRGIRVSFLRTADTAD